MVKEPDPLSREPIVQWPVKGPGLWSRLAKALSPDQVRHPSQPLFLTSLPRTKADYAREVGDKLDSSVVMAPVQWIQRAMAEARFRVVKDTSDGGIEEVEGHALTALIERPNDFYSGAALLSATVLSYITAGNGYWQVVRNGASRPVELWYAPHSMMALKFPVDGSQFLSSYEYKPGLGEAIKLEIEDVVHFRNGLDPRNPRLGRSPLAAVTREIFVDLEASNFSASLLSNLGVPGLVLSPKGERTATPDEVEATKKWLREAFTGDRRGQPMVMGAPTDVKEFGFSPDKMALKEIRNVAEERVCAALGIPAAVVGFGTGLQSTKVGATMTEMRKLAWINGVLPILIALAAEITRTLLPGFGRAEGLRCEFDTSGVMALRDEKKFPDAMMVSEKRKVDGLEFVEGTDAIYIESSKIPAIEKE